MKQMKRLVRLHCWWFGCDPDWNAIDGFLPCKRCGRETSYADRVGDTRYHRFRDTFLPIRFLRKIWPRKCRQCGHRWMCNYPVDHIPF